MVVLGLLARHGPHHGYELRKLIESQNIDRFSNVQLGSIYATLKRLAREGLVVAGSSEPSPGRGPGRTVHAITDPGRSTLADLLDRSLVGLDQPERPVDLALHFSSLLPVDTVVELLERRVTGLVAYGRGVDDLMTATTHPDPGVQELIRDIGEHFAAINEAERAWTERVLACARSGGYRVRSPGTPT